MKVLEKINNNQFPLSWVNLDYFPDSNGKKKEIYINTDTDTDTVKEMILLFYSLFSNVNNIEVYNSSWWDYCLETWDIQKDQYDYTLEGKSLETKEYLLLLSESNIEIDYSGSCICLDWDKFLNVSIRCLISHKAPYSPIFYDKKNDFFFYFHHTCSVGFYYRIENEIVCRILEIAGKNYNVI